MLIQIWHINGEGFHFGRHGLGQEESTEGLPSDSLFAALVIRLIELRGNTEMDEWVKQFLEPKPPFLLSSVFPRVGQVRLYPVPLQKPNSIDAPQFDGKSIKSIKYVSEGIFLHLIQGNALSEIMRNLDKEINLFQEKKVLISNEETQQVPFEVQKKKVIWKHETRPRVRLDRQTNSSGIYMTGRTSFAEGCGLWFGTSILQEGEASQMLDPLLADLADAGFGGVRTNGFGQATLDKQVQKIELPEALGKPWVTLSRYLPMSDEINCLQNENATYAIEEVPGWVYSPGKKSERRRPVRMLSEGSILGPISKQAPGWMVDVQPEYDHNQPLGHPVWRNGRALAVGIQIGSMGG